MKYTLSPFIRFLIGCSFLLGSQRSIAQDTLFLDSRFEPVNDITLASFLEIKIHDQADTNRYTLVRQRSNGDYLSVEKYRNAEKPVLQGRSRYWYDNNQLFCDVMYENGQQQGKETVYYPTGNTKRTLIWDHDTIVKGTFFQEDGLPQTQIFKEDLARIELLEPPSFPGGELAMLQYLSSKVHYPQDARENNIQGTVLVKFLVERNGQITQIEILKKVYSSIDKEALRVVKTLPAFIPAKRNHFPVKMSYTLPIGFRLE